MKQVTLDLARAPTASFEHFYAGPNAKLLEILQDAVARLVCLGGAHAGGPAASPPLLESVVLCGDRGSGKTHLLNACAHLAQTHGMAVMHWQVQSSLNPRDPSALSAELEFNAAWRLMVIDDVHLMSEQDQATAFNWFVNASAPGDHTTRMVLMSSDQNVGALAIREDLRTRMAQGLCLELKTLDEQACRTVLIEQARLRGLVLKADVLDFMMTRFSRDLSNLVGWLDQLDAFSLQTQRAITIPLIKDMLNEL